MSKAQRIMLELPDDLASLRLPVGVQHRLDDLLDKQDQGGTLTEDEQSEAEGLVNLAELLALLKMRSMDADDTSEADGA